MIPFLVGKFGFALKVFELCVDRTWSMTFMCGSVHSSSMWGSRGVENFGLQGKAVRFSSSQPFYVNNSSASLRLSALFTRNIRNVECGLMI